MNYLSIILASFPFLCSTTLFSAYMMDSGRMNNNPSNGSYHDSYYDDGQLAYNSATGPQSNVLDSEPVPQERRFYQYPQTLQERSFYHYPPQRVYSPDPFQPPQFNQDTYPYEPTDYDNKNRRWAFDYNSTEESPWVVDNQDQLQYARRRQHDPLSDDGISQQIRNHLKQDPLLSNTAKRVEVHVNRGNVTLTGTVPNETEKNKIMYITNNIDGVKEVKDKMTIGNQ